MLKKISSIFGLIISISTLVYLFKINADTKIDAFQQPFKPGEKDKFFTFYTNITSADIGMNCELYGEAILNSKVHKLGDVFYLNIENIHTKSSQLIFLFFLFIISQILTLFVIFSLPKTNSLLVPCLAFFIILGNAISFILNFVFFILMALSFYKGDTYRFVKFLDCVNINREEFGNYKFAEKLSKDFKIFMILNIISFYFNLDINKNVKANDKKRQDERKIVEVVESK